MKLYSQTTFHFYIDWCVFVFIVDLHILIIVHISNNII